METYRATLSEPRELRAQQGQRIHPRAHGLRHLRTRSHHPQTTRKMERSHRTIKDVVTLVVHTRPDALRAAITAFMEYHNRERHHQVDTPLAGVEERDPG